MCADRSRPTNSADNKRKAALDEERLASLAYETTVSPARYDELLADWDSHIRPLLHRDGAEPLAIDLTPELARHFERALQVFESIGRQQTVAELPDTVQTFVDTQASCALAFDARGDLIATNKAARELLGLSAAPGFEELPIDGITRASLRDALTAVRESGEISPLVVRDNMDRPLVLMARAADAEGVVLANAVEGQWSRATERLLSHAFDLSTTELSLVRSISEGLNPKQIAEQRSRSIDTVRTQLKAVQQKTGAHSQIELMLLVTGLVFASNTNAIADSQDFAEAAVADSQHPPKKPPPPPNALKGQQRSQTKVMTLQDGRSLAYDDLGAESALNVAIFLHGMLDSPTLPLPFVEQLLKANTRCLCIHRPGYGSSSPNATEDNLGELFAADLEEFLDVLNIGQASLIGHLSGGVIACISASILGNRISAVVNINGGVPIVSRRQFDVMMPRQRVMALTARYAPRALPLMVRAGVALLDSGGERSFMRSLHRNSPRDHRLTQREDVFAQLTSGYRFVTAQGHEAFRRESVLVTSNWDSYVSAISAPVTCIHGAFDGVVAIDSVRDFVHRHPEITLIEQADYGQLMLYGYPAEIGKLTIAALRQARPHRQRSAS